jgi:hypothetical protein
VGVCPGDAIRIKSGADSRPAETGVSLLGKKKLVVTEYNESKTYFHTYDGIYLCWQGVWLGRRIKIS